MSPRLSAATARALAPVRANAPASRPEVSAPRGEISSISDAFAKVSPAGPEPSRVRAWRVLHASNGYDAVSSLLEAQTALGMHPSIVTPEGLFAEGAMQQAGREGSLFKIWSSIRRWRRALLDSGGASCEIVHAHCFPAGMAGVRNFPVVVYEVERFIDDFAGDNPATARTWAARPLRLAERFVLSRAAAVVVRAGSVRQALLGRGAQAEHIFVIPNALPVSAPDVLGATARVRAGGAFAVFSSIAAGTEWRGWLRDLLRALNSAARETAALALHLRADAALRRDVRRYVAGFELGFEMRLLDEAEAAADEALAACSLVVTGAASQPGITPLENPLAVAALRLGKPLLAADLPCNRDVTPHGSGCLWFHAGDAADLAKRIAFLASNEAFRLSLAGSGARYLRDARDPLRVAEKYDAVYRHAFARRHSGNLQAQAVRWQPMQACI